MMSTQKARFEQQLMAGNVKPFPVDSMIAPNVAPAARSGLGPVTSRRLQSPPNPGVIRNLEQANLISQIQRGARITRLR